jgi:hypothetical protein
MQPVILNMLAINLFGLTISDAQILDFGVLDGANGANKLQYSWAPLKCAYWVFNVESFLPDSGVHGARTKFGRFFFPFRASHAFFECKFRVI